MEHPYQYVKAMSHFNHLFPLWSPEPVSKIKPGDCGYFDLQGDWHSVLDMRTIQAEDLNLTVPPRIPEPEPKALGRWQPICSEGVQWKRSVLETPVKLAIIQLPREA